MKNFIQPVSMLVTENQFKTDLKQPLIDLGYNIDPDLLDFNESDLLVTNCSGVNKKCCNINRVFKNDNNRYFIKTYNPKLFLALAAMTDIKEGSIGEYWKKVGDHGASAFTLNKLYKQIKPSIKDGCALLDNNGDENGLGDNVFYFRKATKEEIIEEFGGKKVDTNRVCFKTDSTIETGAMIIEELKKLGGLNDRNWEGTGSIYSFYYINEDGIISCEKEVPSGYTLKKLKSDIKMKNRILTPENAQRIIAVACSTWKSKLADEWARSIVLDRNIEISEEFYKEMRKACTSDQNKLFDEIFGSDEQFIMSTDLKVGEAMIVKNHGHLNDRIVLRTYDEYVDIHSPMSTWHLHNFNNVQGKRVKLTITHEEVK